MERFWKAMEVENHYGGFCEMYGLLPIDIVITNLTNVYRVLTAYHACQALKQACIMLHNPVSR